MTTVNTRLRKKYLLTYHFPNHKVSLHFRNRHNSRQPTHKTHHRSTECDGQSPPRRNCCFVPHSNAMNRHFLFDHSNELDLPFLFEHRRYLPKQIAKNWALKRAWWKPGVSPCTPLRQIVFLLSLKPDVWNTISAPVLFTSKYVRSGDDSSHAGSFKWLPFLLAECQSAKIAKYTIFQEQMPCGSTADDSERKVADRSRRYEALY